MKKGKLLFFILTLFTFSLFSNNVFADSGTLPFSVEPIMPETQDKEISSYISVNADNSFKDELEFKVTNTTNELQEIKVTVVDAHTSPNGVVQYTNESTENNKILNDKYKLSNYTDGDGVITLEAKETKTVSIPIEVDNYQGVLLGGVSFSGLSGTEEVEKEEQTFKINNEINVVIGVMLNFGEKDNIDLSIDEPVIDPMPAYYAIRLPITFNSSLLQKFDVEYEVLSDDQVLFSNEKEFTFAPKTQVNMAIPWESEEIKKNKTYTIKGVFKYLDSEDNEKEITFDKDFKYEVENETSVINALKAPTEKGISSYWFVFGIALLLFIALVFIMKKRKKEKP